MKEKERNKRLFLLLNKLIGEKDYNSIELIETMLKNDHPSMLKTFEIMTVKNELYEKDI